MAEPLAVPPPLAVELPVAELPAAELPVAEPPGPGPLAERLPAAFPVAFPACAEGSPGTVAA
ncbi:hypothetical protein MOQ72_38035 [Saccharopolyspora sp. K220]|uniref:hypothetical protein n=1 Tax=Saccharopolyspora soli TaxID=2926618 RepID=UPI001F59577A|nr:hypothetical protein [Saccharopolyspora soli]MCI2423236.1 hypothetical protein [Saccharopolyspora soli]